MITLSFTHCARNACARFPARTLFRAIAQLSLVAACATRQSAPRPELPPLSPPDSAVQPRRVAPVFHADSSQWSVQATVITVELSPGVGRDSTVYEEVLHSVVTVHSDSTAELMIWADSGMRVVSSDSVRPIARQSLTGVQEIRLRYDLTPHSVERIASDTAAGCFPALSLLSPLVAHLLAYSLIPNPVSATDSMQFVTCAPGAPITSRYVLQHEHHPTDATVAQKVSISGDLKGDSSSFLPMHLHGRTSGFAEILSRDLTRSTQIKVAHTTDLRFTSSLRAQQLQQRAMFVLQRLP